MTEARTDPRSEVLEAAADLVAAFGAHDRERYFAAFAPEATFLFHMTDRLLASRAAYEAEWASWEAGGFRVLSCTSIEPRVDILTDDVAVLTHRVRTQVRFGAEAQDLAERETIVFRRASGGRWLGVHEHLSPEP